MERLIEIDSEIPKRHPHKTQIEDAVRHSLPACGRWRVWIHVPVRSTEWFIEVRQQGGRTWPAHACARVQHPEGIAALVREALGEPVTTWRPPSVARSLATRAPDGAGRSWVPSPRGIDRPLVSSPAIARMRESAERLRRLCQPPLVARGGSRDVA